MSELAFIPAVIFLVIVAPIWITMHYVTKWRIAKTLSADDEKMLADLWHSAGQMEDRIRQLEKILDSEAPGWRAKA